MIKSDEFNKEKNKSHYNKLYRDVEASAKRIERILVNIENYFKDITTTDTTWVAMFRKDFKEQLKDKQVLELGCGDCVLAVIMNRLGAIVYANDLSSKSGEIIAMLNESLLKENPISFVGGEFLEAELSDNSFDMVVGKAFIHHLTQEEEVDYLEKIARILKPGGEARFVEPAINSKLLDALRWMVPVKGRPSSLQFQKFKAWKAADPHPERENSSVHYETMGKQFFKETEILPIGAIERFHRLMRRSSKSQAFRRKAYRWEAKLPAWMQRYFARAQTVIFRRPLINKI